jgi:putative Mg2+ transporter-C (MgtC) family protein
VASGIGFIGAGAILRDGGSIRGLTTAATLWLAASVGVGAGAGAYPEVAIGTGIVLFTLVGLRWVRPSRLRKGEQVTVDLEYGLGTGILAPILATVKASGSRVESIEVQDEQGRGVRHLSLELFVPGNGKTAALVDALSDIPDLRRVTLQSDEGS